MKIRAPDYLEPIVGWRAWRVARHGEDLVLLSGVYDVRWEPGHEVSASCHAGRRHAAPTRRCRCGVYAVREPAGAVRYLIGRDEREVVHRVIGQVALWGRVIEGDGGWRAEHAYPVRIWVPLARTNGHEAPAMEVLLGLERYGVPLETAYDPWFASTSRPLPDSLAR
jgi:hypothetical protein